MTHTLEPQSGNCVYILKTGKNLFKIGKTHDLQKRLVSYHTHLPILFRVIRQYHTNSMAELETGLHIVFQHKRIKGEWFELTQDDLTICDNIARNYAESGLLKSVKRYRDIEFSDNPLLQVMEANEKYLRDYSKIVDNLKLGLRTEEIIELYEGAVNKTIVETVRRLLKYQTPNSEFLSRWIHVVNDLDAGATEKEILEKYKGQISRATLQMIRRILRNQLY